MEKIELNNFKIFKEKTEFDLLPITILTGRNNSGKSSIIKALLLMDDFLNSNDQFYLKFSQKNIFKHKINGFKNAISWESDKNYFTIGFTKGNKFIQFEFKQDKENETIAVLNKFLLKVIDSEIMISLTKSDDTDDLKYILTFNESTPDYFKHVINSNVSYSKISSQIKNVSKEIYFLKNHSQLQIKDPLKYNLELEKLRSKEFELESQLNELNALVESKKMAKQSNIVELNIDYHELREGSKSIAEVIGLNLINWFNERESKNNEAETLSKIVTEAAINNTKSDAEKNQIIEKSKKILNEYRYTSLKNKNEFDTSFSLVYYLRALMFFKVNHLSPNRTRQERLYIKNSAQTEIEYEIADYHEFQKQSKDNGYEWMTKWLSAFGLGDNIMVENIEGVANKIKISSNNKLVDLVDMGFGSGQILTILLKIYNTIKNQRGFDKLFAQARSISRNYGIIIIEEPESNLHPQFQSKMAELIADTYITFGIRFIIETHSEYFIRNLQLLVAEKYKNLDRENAVIYYLNNNDSEEQIKKLSINEDGSLNGRFGEGFLDEATQKALKLMAFKNKT